MDEEPPNTPDRTPYLVTFLGVIAVIAVVIVIVAIVGARRHHTDSAPTPGPDMVSSQSVEPASWKPSTPALPADVTTAWAYIDSAGGDMVLGGDGGNYDLGQLVVPGIAADYLDQRGDATLNPHDLVMLEAALSGNTEAGQQLVDQAGGVDKVLPRIVDNCQLTNTTVGPPAAATVLDMARYGACLREGAIANPATSKWVLDQMRQTAGGIGDVRGNDGGQRLAQFNTTTVGDNGRNRTTCLGVGAYWSAAVVVNWPADRGQLYGVAACAQVARDQFPPDTQKAPASPAPSAAATTCPYGTCRATD
jgi:hypothetical protein